MSELNEGMIDKFFQGLFKLLFKNQLKQAEAYIERVSSKITDEQRESMMKKFQKMEENSRRMKQILDNAKKGKK